MHLILTQVFKFLLGGSFAGDLEFNKYTLEYMGLSGCTLWVICGVLWRHNSSNLEKLAIYVVHCYDDVFEASISVSCTSHAIGVVWYELSTLPKCLRRSPTSANANCIETI